VLYSQYFLLPSGFTAFCFILPQAVVFHVAWCLFPYKIKWFLSQLILHLCMVLIILLNLWSYLFVNS